MRTIGTVVRGVRAPIIKAGDDLANIVVESLRGQSRNGHGVPSLLLCKKMAKRGT